MSEQSAVEEVAIAPQVLQDLILEAYIQGAKDGPAADPWAYAGRLDFTTATRPLRALQAGGRPTPPDAVERLQAIIDWADFALKNPGEFDSHGVRNLDGPVFDEARAFLTRAKAAEILSAPPAPWTREELADLVGKHLGPHLAISPTPRHEAIVNGFITAILARPAPTVWPEPEKGWLPIVLCPTDGVDRALLLPDAREVVGAYRNPGGWRVASVLEVDQPVFDEVRYGLLPMTLEPVKAPERVQVGTRKASMTLYGSLAEGINPTHFRPNDTVYGVASAPLPPARQGES